MSKTKGMDMAEAPIRCMRHTPRQSGQVEMICDCGCGGHFWRLSRNVNVGGLNFLDGKHAGAHKTRIYMEDMCGSFLPLVSEYLNGFAKHHYKNLSCLRSAVCPFVLYLSETGVDDLQSVTPKTITRFLSWAEEMDYQNAGHNISTLSTFLDWSIREGHRTKANPVVHKFHAPRRKHYLPRPYTAEEMALIWEVALSRGNSRVRAAVAIGEEAGLRLSEICRLRIQDVDLPGRRLFVRLPNKTDQERWALFSDKAAKYIAEWFDERPEDYVYDSLLINRRNAPLTSGTLHEEFRRVFCKEYDGRQTFDQGVDQWSTHRLRHTMASNLAAGGASVTTIMMAGGWQSYSSMVTYAKNDPAIVRRGYDEAMAKSQLREQQVTTRFEISPQDFLRAVQDRELKKD